MSAWNLIGVVLVLLTVVYAFGMCAGVMVVRVGG